MHKTTGEGNTKSHTLTTRGAKPMQALKSSILRRPKSLVKLPQLSVTLLRSVSMMEHSITMTQTTKGQVFLHERGIE